MKNSTKQTLSIYKKFVFEHKTLGFVVFFCVVGANFAGTITPIYYKKLFDIISIGKSQSNLWESLIIILLSIAFLEALRWIFWRISSYANIRFQPRVIEKLTNFCFSELHRHSFSYFTNNFTGSLVKRVNWFTRAFEGIADRVTYELIPLITGLTIILTVLAKRNVLIFVSIVIWLVVFLLVNWLFIRIKIKYDIQRNEAESKSTAVLADTITNNQNVKLFGGYQREISLFSSLSKKVRKLRELSWGKDALFDSIQGFLVMALELVILFLSVNLWMKDILTIGDFVLIQAYLGIIFERIWGFGKIIRHIYTNLADAEEMTILLNTPPEINDTKEATELQVKNGGIIFDSVIFNYHETRRVINDFGLEIKPKEKIAFVGSSGSGKTTIIKLLLRMYDLTGGKICIDGQEINHVKQESLWRNISLVPQDPILFHRTLMENIRYGKTEATDDEVISASKLANCHDFIVGLPEKYNTLVGERGIKLSGGERQRVAIARAILRNAPILVLDEATSSLDSESEALIQEALNNLMKEKTVIVIAHRLSTIMKMDRIIVMKDGKIIETGKHSDLLKNSVGFYNNLWKIQAGGFLSEDNDETLVENSNHPTEE